MGKWGGMRKQGGYSTIEVMIAAALIGFIAIAVLPSVFSLVDTSKVQTFRALCSSIARSKLQEYITGVPTASRVPSGFEYTKKRYQQFQTDCEVNPSPGSPGFRESINGNGRVADDSAQEPGLPINMQGLRVFVNLTHYNPRRLVGGQPTRACPPATYQFFRLGDGIEVTVTAMIRTTPTVAAGGRDGKPYGKLLDLSPTTPNQALVCSATQIVYPPRLPFRYYLGNDGKIRNYQAMNSFLSGEPGSSPEAMEAHFRDLWSTDATSTGTISSPVIANIRSFAVAPNNKSVYLLKPGVVELYSSCSDGNVTVGGLGYEGIPKCSPGVVTQHRIHTTGSNIENIAVDFKSLLDPSTPTASEEDAPYTTDDVVYGLQNTGTGRGISGGVIMRLDRTVDPAVWVPNTATDGIEFRLPADRPRIRAMFISQNFPAVTRPNLFFIDNTCFTGGAATTAAVVAAASTWTHCASVFGSGDDSMSQDIRELPSQVEGVSY